MSGHFDDVTGGAAGADPTGPVRRAHGHEATLTDEQSLAAVRDSEALVDLLAARVELHELEQADPLAAALGGWVRTIDLEVTGAVLPVAAGATGYALGHGSPGEAHGVAGVNRMNRVNGVNGVNGLAGAATADVFPVARRSQARGRRTPWWLLSASAAAVIAVLAVGVGIQDVQQVGPGTSVAESVESIEATLTASRRAAEAGDVAGARVLLEQARAMVAGLPAEERGRWEVAVRAAEQGLRTAEERVREGGATADDERPGGSTSVPTDPGRPDDGGTTSTTTTGTTGTTSTTTAPTTSTTTSTSAPSTPTSSTGTTPPDRDRGPDEDSPRQDDDRRPTTTPTGPPGGQGRTRPDGARTPDSP